MNPLTRRSVTTGLAAAVTAIPALGLSKGAKTAPPVPGAGELAAKIRKLRSDWDGIGEMTDAEADGKWKKVIRPYYKTFVGVPARSAEDALAALDYLIEEDLIETGANGYEKVVESLVKAIRDYIAASGGLKA